MKYTLMALCLTLFVSCSNTGDDNEPIEPVDYTAQNEQEIISYLETNNLVAEKSSTGLHYIITEEGSGGQADATSEVTVAYKGYYTNGNVFDESDAEGITFNLQGVIAGWTEGIQYFKEGGSGILLIPSHLGYGSFDYRGIPGGSVLVFEVSVITVE